MKRFLPLILACMVLASGCVVTESENVETSGMWAHFVIDHHPDDTVEAWAVLRVGGQLGTIIDLVGADQMQCNGTRMIEYIEPVTNMHWTRAEVAVDPDGLYDFEFIREDEYVVTTVETPDIPFITNPPDGDIVYPEEEIALMWDDLFPADHVNIWLFGECIHNQAELEVEDDGDYLMPPLQDLDPQNPQDCSLYLELRRWQGGSVNQAFQDGYTEAKRMDAIDLLYQQ